MALEPGRRLFFAAVISLAVWAFTWLMAIAILPFSGVAFWYLFFGIAEPLIFLLAAFTSAAAFVAVVVTVQFILHIVAFILRVLAVTRPFVVGELLDIVFIILELIAVFIYLWYTYAAYRNAAADGGAGYKRD